MTSQDMLVEQARQAARRAVDGSSLRRVSSEIGISHQTLADFIAAGSTRSPYGSSREKLLAWARANGAREPGADQLNFYRGKQEALMGMMQYIVSQQAEIGAFMDRLRSGEPEDERRPRQRTHEELSREVEGAEADAELLARLQSLQKSAEKKGKKRA
ncbi:MAG: hypothetical protein KF709_02505 [Gemmatimonadaceae bacterium]|nr:hypothetical protein [Gemmatimonadaceae bacterium]